MNKGPWLRSFRPVPAPTARLVCLPHAGGTSVSFRSWAGAFPAEVEVLAVCYPGRQDRLGEPTIESMPEMADAVADALLPLASTPFVLFGHSMGASVAFETALLLERAHGHVPAALLVSGRAAPRRLVDRGVFARGDAAIIADVHRLGEASSAVLDEPELRELVLPAIRADYHLVDSYRPSLDGVTSAPIVAYGGTDDPDIAEADLLPWAEHTSAGFAHRLFPGDHFYLNGAADELIADIAARQFGEATRS